MDNLEYYRAWAEVDLDAVKTNIANIKERLKDGTKTCAVIKADGYGHGAVPIARAISKDVDFFATATIDEATNLRVHNINKPILVLGFVHPFNTFTAINNDIRLAVFDLETAEKYDEYAKDAGKKVKVHIKIDTGMSRIGFIPNDKSLEAIVKISELKNVEIEGIFTHFHSADEADTASAYKQLELFNGFIERLAEKGIRPAIRHCSNSSASIRMPEANLDMVRLGINIYGLYPSDAVKEVTPVPVMSLYSHVTFVKEINAGDSVGYNARFKAERKTKIATVGIGYADGYQRRLSCIGYALIRGKKAPIAGGVCMDQIMLDVTDIPDVQAGDIVTLIGSDGDECITMEELAALCGTINYEFACDIGKRIPRVYYSGGKEVAAKDYFYDRY